MSEAGKQALIALARKPWWCDCSSTEGLKGKHEPTCYGEQPAFPKLTAALERSA